jgi:DNA-binding NarL/FixJ family response regulator
MMSRVSFAERGGVSDGTGSERGGISTAIREPSARECEVLTLLAAGATDREIATALELSPATVQTHVRNAKAKLGARTRTQAVALALQQDLLRPR